MKPNTRRTGRCWSLDGTTTSDVAAFRQVPVPSSPTPVAACHRLPEVLLQRPGRSLRMVRERSLGRMGLDAAAGSWASSPGRRRNMQANRSRDTQPELDIRRALHRLGLRYRVAIAPVPGLRRRADIVFTRARVAVFIDGCFWHGCPAHGRSTFNHNAGYWSVKIATNVARDADTNAQLGQAGWRVLRYWEHENAEDVAADIRRVVLSVTSPPSGEG